MTATGTEFGRLESVAIKSAWTHEAHSFTPWLAQNLDRLSEALGIPLEHIESEAPVLNFYADILARNPIDGTNVLIENQLEQSDHKHLGQIMTYLAGLDAHTVVWLAPKFQEAHLSAIQWLNKNTAEPFAFFAVELRVVRIGTSPLAPIFEVVERPNDWERTLQEQTRAAKPTGATGEFRKAFWEHFLARYPAETDGGPPTGASSRWRLPVGDFVVAQYVAQDAVGVFIRGQRGVPSDQTGVALEPYREQLETATGAAVNGNNFFFITRLPFNSRDPANWDRMSDWLRDRANACVSALQNAVRL